VTREQWRAVWRWMRIRKREIAEQHAPKRLDGYELRMSAYLWMVVRPGEKQRA